MKTMKTIAVLFAASLFAGIQLASAQNQVVLLEQAINFRLKITTLNTPDINTVGTEVSAKFTTFSGSLTTKDILQAIGYSPSAKLIARVVADTSTSPADVSLHIIVQQGTSETDVTSILGDLVPAENPIADLNQGLAATGVFKGKAKASLTKGTALVSLNVLTYEQLTAQLGSLLGPNTPIGGLDFNASGVSKMVISLRGSLSRGVTLGLNTNTKVVGGAMLTGSSTPIPAIIEGTITTHGRNTVSSLDILSLIDLSQILSSN